MSAPNIPQTFEDAKPLLRTRLYGAVGHRLRAQELVDAGAATAIPGVVRVSGEILVGCVIDVDRGFVPVGETFAHDAWGVDLDAVIEAAQANNRGREVQIARVGEGAFVVTDEQLSTHILLNPSSISSIPVKGDVVALVPGAGTLLLAGSQDPASLAVILAAAEGIARDGEGLVSAQPLVRQGEGWAEFTWPDDPDIGVAADRLSRLFAATWYGIQNQLLQKGSAYPAKAEVFAKAGVPVLVATWTKGTETLLPVVDDVVIVDDATGATSAMPFGAFIDLNGVTTTDLEPRRYHVAANTQR